MLKDRTIGQKLGSVMFAGLMVLTAGAAVAAAPASATACSTTLHRENAPLAPDPFRASASCSDIDYDDKVRAKLDRNNYPDVHSVWFSTEDTTRYTDWRTCLAGCDADYEVGRR